MSVIYDESGNRVYNPDLTLGYLSYQEKTVYHQWIVDVEEQGHWETIYVNPETGGSEVEWVVDVPEQGHWQTTDDGNIVSDFDGVISDDWPHEQTISDIWYYYIYVLYTEEELDAQKRQESERALYTIKNTQSNNAISYVAMKAGLSDTVAMSVNLIFPEWTVGFAYSTGDVCNYDGNLYRALADNIGVSGSTPDVSTTDWQLINQPVDDVPSWIQPASVDTAYTIDDEVMYNGVKWVSTIKYNVWTPGVSGWTEVV